MYSVAIVAIALLLLIAISAFLPRSYEGYATTPILNDAGNDLLASYAGSANAIATNGAIANISTNNGSTLTVGGTNSANNIVVEGGRTSDGQNAGFSAVNFNGNYDGGERRTNNSKSRWRLGVDQRGGTDRMFMDQYKTDGTFWSPLYMEGGSTYAKGAVKVGHEGKGDWTDGTPLSVVKQTTGASFRGGQLWSHFPWSDENVYIRPGVGGANIKIGDIGNPSSIQIKDSWFPYTDGNAYIRAGGNDKTIKIGDVNAGSVQVKDSWFPYLDGNTYIRAAGNDKTIKIGDVNAGSVQVKDSWFPYSDGHTYIRAAGNDKTIKIGDVNAGSVQVKDSWFPYSDGHTYIRAGGNDKTIKIGDVNAGKIEMGAPVAGLKINDDLRFVGNNNWILHTPDDGRRTMYVAPSGTAGQENWNWGAQTRFEPDGTVAVNKLMSSSGVEVTGNSQGGPGPLLQTVYGNDPNHRYGVGQWYGGKTRMYAATQYGDSSVNLSFSKADGSFNDVLTAKNNGNVTVQKLCVGNKCMNEAQLTTMMQKAGV